MRNLIPPRPKWSLKASFLMVLLLVAVIAPLVFLVVHRSIWTELEIVTAIVAVLVFLYLTLVLYLGVRFDRKERFTVAWLRGNPITLLDVVDLPSLDSPVFTELGSHFGLLGFIIGLLIDLLATAALIMLISIALWVGINGLIAVTAAICLPLFYFYRRSLRMIVAKGRDCRSNWPKSLRRAALSTLGYTAWFYGIFVLAHQIETWRLT